MALQTELVPKISTGISIGSTIDDNNRLFPLILKVREAAIDPINEIVKVPRSKLTNRTIEAPMLDVRRQLARKPMITNGIIVKSQQDITLAKTLNSST